MTVSAQNPSLVEQYNHTFVDDLLLSIGVLWINAGD